MTQNNDIQRVIGTSQSGAKHEHQTYCVGCGNCVFVDPAFQMIKNDDGCYQAIMSHGASGGERASGVCPFASTVNEDVLGKDLFGEFKGIQHNDYLGYYLSAYVGYAKKGDFRDRGSSGGLISWLASTMLSEGFVDAVIHVKDGPDAEHMYTYQVSHTVDELKSGAKSKYYPVEMAQVLDYVAKHDGRYLFIGIPCFVKAIRLLAMNDDVIARRIRYCIGLVCGHLKSDFFAKSEAWESGVPVDKVKRVDFRYKTPGSPASDYAVAIDRTDGSPTVKKRTAELSTTNWGLGYFKYNACDYCDDVLAETADVAFGDAWLPKYVNDASGSNVIVVRNPIIQTIFNNHKDELELFDSSPEEIYQSQAGGFRHRRQGLQYRIRAKEQKGAWVPTKRVSSNIGGMTKRRQKIYAMRTVLKDESFIAYHQAIRADNFTVFQSHMKPFERKYAWLNMTPKKAIRKAVKRVIPARVLTALKKIRKR